MPTAPPEITAPGSGSTPSAPVQIAGSGSGSTPSSPVQITGNGSGYTPGSPVAIATQNQRGVVVSGALTPDATGVLYYAGEAGGGDVFTSNGALGSSTYPWKILQRVGDDWRLTHKSSGLSINDKSWQATYTPDPLDADDWEPYPIMPNNGEGTPVLAAYVPGPPPAPPAITGNGGGSTPAAPPTIA